MNIESSQIKLHLINRYLYGYNIMDLFYEEIKRFLWNILQYRDIEQTIEPFINSYAGQYNDVTAQLYFELADLYLRKVKQIMKPSTIEICKLIQSS